MLDCVPQRPAIVAPYPAGPCPPSLAPPSPHPSHRPTPYPPSLCPPNPQPSKKGGKAGAGKKKAAPKGAWVGAATKTEGGNKFYVKAKVG